MSENAKPDVSICIPLYNGAQWLVDALNSVEAQEFRGSIEVVISDDNSSDHGVSIAKDIALKSRHQYVFTRNTRAGIGRNWNNAIKFANGQAIILLMQDDYLSDVAVEKMYHHLLASSNIGMVFSKRKIKFENGFPKEGQESWLKKFEILQTNEVRALNGIIGNGKIFLRSPTLFREPLNKVGEPSCVMFKREVVSGSGQFSHLLKQNLDFEMWYRIMRKYDFFFIDEELMVFRRHHLQASEKNSKSEVGIYRERIIFFILMLLRVSPYLHAKSVRWCIAGVYYNLFFLTRSYLNGRR